MAMAERGSKIDAKLLELLACPLTKGPLDWDAGEVGTDLEARRGSPIRCATASRSCCRRRRDDRFCRARSRLDVGRALERLRPVGMTVDSRKFRPFGMTLPCFAAGTSMPACGAFVLATGEPGRLTSSARAARRSRGRSPEDRRARASGPRSSRRRCGSTSDSDCSLPLTRTNFEPMMTGRKRSNFR